MQHYNKDISEYLRKSISGLCSAFKRLEENQLLYISKDTGISTDSLMWLCEELKITAYELSNFYSIYGKLPEGNEMIEHKDRLKTIPECTQ